MEPGHNGQIVPERLAVASFEALGELPDGLRREFFGLLDFHDCSPVSGTSCPLHPKRRGQAPETADGSGEMGASRLERAAPSSDTGVSWRERC